MGTNTKIIFWKIYVVKRLFSDENFIQSRYKQVLGTRGLPKVLFLAEAEAEFEGGKKFGLRRLPKPKVANKEK